MMHDQDPQGQPMQTTFTPGNDATSHQPTNDPFADFAWVTERQKAHIDTMPLTPTQTAGLGLPILNQGSTPGFLS